MKENKIRIPQQERAIEKKTSIINAAIELFSQRGFHKTNSKKIADKAGVSVGTFYAYFRDKRAVFLEIVNTHIVETVNTVFNSVDTITEIPLDKKSLVKSIIQPFIQAHTTYPELHEVIISLKHTNPEIHMAWIENENKSFKRLEKVLKKWKSELRIKDCKTAAVLIQTTTEEIIHMLTLSSHNYVKVNKKHMLDELVDMITRYVFE